MTDSDIVVVGAGSAGCLLASSLASRFGLRVTLVESPSTSAPATDRQRPSRWIHLLKSGDDWNFLVARGPELAGRDLHWPRGRGMGGSGRINAMIWFPPTAQDYRDLHQAGGTGWESSILQRAYQEVESAVRPESPRWLSPAAQRFLAAASFPESSPIAYRRLNRRGERWTPDRLLQGKPQLNVCRATVRRVDWHGDRAIGVVAETENGTETIGAAQGVVLCAGAIASPAILMRSGIGPTDTLRDAGIDVFVDSPGVGGRLQDHLIMPVVFRMPAAARYSDQATPRQLARWQSVGRGPVACNLAECGGLFEGGQWQLHVTPTHYLSHPSKAAPSAMTLGVNVTHPDSRGRLRVASSRTEDPIVIEPGYLREPSDLARTIEGVRLCRQIAAKEPLGGWLEGELLPGARRDSDEGIAKSIARYAQTLYHPVGTCAMGRDANDVVDADLRVRGADRLWVADASVLPRLTTANPNATVMTVAHRGATRIASQIDTTGGSPVANWFDPPEGQR